MAIQKTLEEHKAGKVAAIRRLMSPLMQAMEDQGITPDMLIGKLKEELDAYDTKFFSHQGMIVSAQNVVDWGTRQRARMDAHRLRGDYAPENINIGFSEGASEYTPEEQEALELAVAMVAKKKLEQIRGEDEPAISADTTTTDTEE